MDNLILIAYVSTGSSFLPILMGFYTWGRQDRPIKFLILFLVAAGVVDGISTYLATNRIHNVLLMNLFILIAYCSMAYIFSFWHQHGVKRGLRTSIILFAILWTVRYLFYGGLMEFDEFSNSLSTVSLTVIAVYTLLRFQKVQFDSSLQDPRFWVSAIVLIFYGGNLLIHSFQPSTELWAIRNILNIFTNLLYAWGLIWTSRKPILAQ